MQTFLEILDMALGLLVFLGAGICLMNLRRAMEAAVDIIDEIRSRRRRRNRRR